MGGQLLIPAEGIDGSGKQDHRWADATREGWEASLTHCFEYGLQCGGCVSLCSGCRVLRSDLSQTRQTSR